MRDVHLLGVGATSFLRPGARADGLAREAVLAALADAGVASAEVGAYTLATSRRGEVTSATALLGPEAPRPYLPICLSGAAALHLGWRAVASGAHDVVVCIGEQLAGSGGGPVQRVEALARSAERYLEMTGASEQHLARVASKNRAHGAANPRALLSSPIDTASVLASELVAWPLRAPMVALPSKAAAAVVLAASDPGRHGGARAPRVRASVLLRQDDAGTRAAAARAARLTYEAAGVGPEDVDCAEVDHPTAAGELAAYEVLGFAPDGRGPDLVDSGFTALGGVVPVNTSGGALSQGEAPAAAGIAQVCELGWQLRGEAERRQVAGARVGLALSAPMEKGGRMIALTLLSAA
jgi:acetyl-CoA acetyltransferase